MLAKKYLSNIKWLFSDTLIRLFVTFFMGVLTARYMGVENFGLYSYLLAIFSIFIVLSNLGLNGIVVKELVLREKHEEILGSALFLQRLASFIITLGLLFWAVNYNSENKDFLLLFLLMLPTLLIQSSNIYKYWFEYQVKSKFSVIAQNISLVCGLLLKLLVIILNMDYRYLVAITILEQVILVGIVVYFFKIQTNFKLKINKSTCLDLLSKSWPLAISGLAFILYIRVDQIMIGEILGVSQVGIFSVAIKFIEVSFFIPIVLMSTFTPLLVALREKSIQDYNLKMQTLYDIVSVLGFFIIGFLLVFGDLFIKYTFGLDYLDAILQLKIYSIVCLFYFLNSVSGRWYINEGLQKVALFRNILGLVLAITLNFLLIPIYGLTGASISTVISYIFSAYIYDFFDSRTRVVFYQKTRALLLFGAIKRLKLEYLK